jgi:hypothetical protein
MKAVKVIVFAGIILSLVLNVAIAQNNALTIKPYGFIKLDMAYDQARTNNGNYAFWVNSAGNKSEESEFNMTARQTRLGANISYDNLDDKVVTARFEVDFYGGGTENKNMPMLRHGYMKIDYGKYYILAGQTSDVISPLVPSTVNYTVLWNNGNIGYRHPQLQIGFTCDHGVEFVGALSRNIAGDFDNDGNDDGESSSLPTVQGRVSYGSSGMNVGLSGHYGKVNFTGISAFEDSESYSINAHYSCSFMDIFQVKGELFNGVMLDQYLGGIGQAFDTTNGEGIESSGGWINASASPTSNTVYNIGVGVDKPETDGGKVTLTRNSNTCIFGNVMTSVAHNTTCAVEISHMTTGYYDNAQNEIDTSDVRFHLSLIHNLK